MRWPAVAEPDTVGVVLLPGDAGVVVSESVGGPGFGLSLIVNDQVYSAAIGFPATSVTLAATRAVHETSNGSGCVGVKVSTVAVTVMPPCTLTPLHCTLSTPFVFLTCSEKVAETAVPTGTSTAFAAGCVAVMVGATTSCT